MAYSRGEIKGSKLGDRATGVRPPRHPGRTCQRPRPEDGAVERRSEGGGRQLGLGQGADRAQEAGVGEVEAEGGHWAAVEDRSSSVGPEESTYDAAGGTQGRFGGLERGVSGVRLGPGGTEAGQAGRRAEGRLSGQTAWPESRHRGRTACDGSGGCGTERASPGARVQTSRTQSVPARACGYASEGKFGETEPFTRAGSGPGDQEPGGVMGEGRELEKKGTRV